MWQAFGDRYLTFSHSTLCSAGFPDSSGSNSTRVRKRTAPAVVLLLFATTCLISVLVLGGTLAIAGTENTAFETRKDGPESPNRAASDTSNAEQAESLANAAPPKTLSDLVKLVRKNEALYKNLDYTVEIDYGMPNGPTPDLGQRPLAPSPWNGEKWRAVTSDGWLYFKGERSVPSMGKTGQTKWISVFDGRETVSIEEGNSTTVHEGRYEHSHYLPPHALPLYQLAMNYPLSVYLQGTEAMKAHPKVRHFIEMHGLATPQLSKEDINRVEAEVLGDENIEGLDCVKVRVRSWCTSAFPPEIELLWLAKDRNYHVAQWQASFAHQGAELLDKKGRVVKWLEVAKGVWLPAVVDMSDLGAEGHAIAPQINKLRDWHTKLSVKRATLDPKLPQDLFKLPKIPASLPKFVMDKDGNLADSPNHPVPVQAEQETTVEEILRRLAEEEKRYGRYEVAINKHYRAANGVSIPSDTRWRIVFDNDRFYLESEEVSNYPAGRTATQKIKSACDGKWTRLRQYEISQGFADDQPRLSANLYLVPYHYEHIRPHTLFEWEMSSMWLSTIFRPDRSDVTPKKTRKIEYLGDCRIGDLYCHKLKVSYIPDTHFVEYYFLARDRNMLPIREESVYLLSHKRLPAFLSFLQDLREIKPGIWYPYRATTLHFRQSFGALDGLCENRLVVDWRRDWEVKKLTVDPPISDKLFTQNEVPQGTTISVRETEEKQLGKYQQDVSGNIDISADELKEMKQKK